MSEPLTLAELRETILGLKMNGFAYIDDESVLDAVRFGIEKLPSAEELDNLRDNVEALKNIGIEVGRIAQLIERGTKRDESYKVRNMARKNLPPRYQVLEWRDNMKQQTANLVKNLVKISAKADSIGFTPMASHLITTAKKAMEDQDIRADLIIASTYLEKVGMEKEAAGMWDYMKGFMGGVGGKARDIAKGVWQAGQAGGLESKYNALYKQIADFKNSVNALADKALDPNVKARMQNLSQQIDVGTSAIAKAAEGLKAVDMAQAPQGAGASVAPQGAGASVAPQATPQAAPLTPDQPVSTKAAGMDSELVQKLMQSNIDPNTLNPEQYKMLDQLRKNLRSTLDKYERSPAGKQRLQQEIDANQAGKTAAPLQPVAQ